MPAPRWLARVNRRLTNRVLGRVAPRLPGFGVVVHTGRASRREYRTPVNVFRRGDAYVIALTYGADSQWVRNVLANGGCALLTRGRRLELARPRLFRDPARRAVPRPIRVVLRLLDVADFLELWPARPPRSGMAPSDTAAASGAGLDEPPASHAAPPAPVPNAQPTRRSNHP